ncbi:phosphonate degradation HD-domain oxygenase [Puia dinghuensis]|uniref:Phosphodiesterase n=1 Tax=Puia dinghuensis TaxID=1792502 RepID=A0A8J2XU08_9BACT|nr:phosphonate degradation HD-domain oxygenase [Puia dinghuensis]GGB07433.1 phosphodiesterase [Puia dinghuensis]
MTIEQAEKITNEIMDLYEEYGGAEYAGEKVSQLEHMAQAAQLAEAQGYDEEVILAAFLHDIGHISEAAKGGVSMSASRGEMDGYGIIDHEELGAEFLREKGFSKKIVRLVESHVEAKRYLTVKEPEYYDQLSEASKKTLEYQGGPMTPEEAAAFEQYPLFPLIIQMRKWDEQAKIEQQPLPDLNHYRQMILRHLSVNA